MCICFLSYCLESFTQQEQLKSRHMIIIHHCIEEMLVPYEFPCMWSLGYSCIMCLKYKPSLFKYFTNCFISHYA